MTIRDTIRKRPAASYFGLTFAISWGSIVIIVGPKGILGTKEEFERLFPMVLPFMVLGPSVSGILLTRLVGGRQALRAFRESLLKWRVEVRWHAVAILTAPLYFTATTLVFSAFSRQFLPGIVTVEDKASFLLRGLAVALVAGIVEELGWMGFAFPTLRRRHSALAAGLIVGGMWGLWHVLPKIWGAAAHGVVADLPADLASAVVGLTGYRILMVWVYERTASLFVSIMMHMGLTASTLILQPAITGRPLMTIGLALTAAPWLIVAAIALIGHSRSRSRRPGPGGAVESL
jgi:membrane protease YdiL (CAAX protease family)